MRLRRELKKRATLGAETAEAESPPDLRYCCASSELAEDETAFGEQTEGIIVRLDAADGGGTDDPDRTRRARRWSTSDRPLKTEKPSAILQRPTAPIMAEPCPPDQPNLVAAFGWLGASGEQFGSGTQMRDHRRLVCGGVIVPSSA